mmetsp:Transcript_17816/g.55448  ORF Transcript_17816/g.55448 Transcript_17816/m.55448 type:complete len:113 (-) Transcript_17816:677-1015(-)
MASPIRVSREDEAPSSGTRSKRTKGPDEAVQTAPAMAKRQAEHAEGGKAEPAEQPEPNCPVCSSFFGHARTAGLCSRCFGAAERRLGARPNRRPTSRTSTERSSRERRIPSL